MGFYGNITNTARTQFQFDKIYPNRYEMENLKSTDGIYAGRYVLIEYDIEHLDAFKRVIFIDGKAYYQNVENNQTQQTLLTSDNTELNEVVYEAKVEKDSSEGYFAKECIFYICIGFEGDKNAAKFVEIANGTNSPTYTVNYNIDTQVYGKGRGYDSTVWQKTYIDGVEKYIMIAELNTVVPTFDVSADAPTQRPLVPHFDTQSTDVYYKLHWQPSWGFRIKEAEKDGDSSINGDIYPSDESANHYTYNFNPDTGRNEKNPEESYAAAIFYNKDGFDKTKRTYYSSEENAVNDKAGNYEDTIIIEPTGQSGNEYNKHDGTSDTQVDTDIQEMRILLPSLGNAISDIWDIVYGYGKKVNVDFSETGDIDNRIRFRDIYWKDALAPEENSELGGMTRDVNTLAGCINHVHDLIGMIVTDKKDEYLTEEGYLQNYIYKDKQENGGYKYYRIDEYPVYTPVESLPELPNKEQFNSDQEYNAEYETRVSKLTGNYYLITENGVELFNEKAISSLKDGAQIATKTGVDYRYTEIEEFAQNLGTIHGCILQIKNLLEVENSETRDTATVTGAINTLKDIINVFEDLIPGEFLICDANGHVNSANWTTKQQYGYTNYGDTSKSQILDNGIENRWLKLSLNENTTGDNSRLISLTHEFNSVTSTTTNSDKNEEQKFTENLGNNNGFSDTLDLYNPIVDATGHVVGHNIETVTLPYGYKTFVSNELTDSTNDLYTNIIPGELNIDATDVKNKDDSINTTVADNTQDILNINTGNKWIQTKVTNDNIIIAHEVHAVKEVARADNLNDADSEGKIQNTITIQDTEYDEAGHIIVNREHEYTLPFGYKFFKTNAISNNSNSDLYTIINNVNDGANTSNVSATTSDMEADNTQDTFIINPGNKWIQTKLDDNNDTLTIVHEIHAVDTQKRNTDLNDGTDTITIQDTEYDIAGHIISNNQHTYTLPYSFKVIKTNGRVASDEYNTEIPNTSDITAENTQDILNINSGNKWVKISTDSNNDTITISHDILKTSSSENTTNNTQNNNIVTIPVITYQYDEAGHYKSHHTENYQLPFGYAQIKGDSGNTAASASYDELTFTSDNWLASQIDQDKVTYVHSNPNPNQLTVTTKSNITAPQFGSTFEIEDWHFDEKGHKYNQTTHTIQFPEGSLVDSIQDESTANVLTSINFNSKTGGITTTHKNVGNLLITDYSKPTSISTQALESKDSLNSALGKLEYRLEDEIKQRNNAIAQEVNERNSAIVNAINNLDYTDVPVENQYVSEVNEIDGKISVKRSNLPTLQSGSTNGTVKLSNGNDISVTGLGTAAYTNSNIYATADQGSKADSALQLTSQFKDTTIENLLNLIIDLNSTVSSLNQKVIELEKIINPPVEEEPTNPDEV